MFTKLANLAVMLVCVLWLTGAPGIATSARAAGAQATNGIVVYQTDFGLKDGAVSAMRGVAVSVDPTLRLEDLTHEIPPFDIWQGAYRLAQTAPYWPAGTVFVAVIDPGVGTDRRSVVLATESGHYFVSPDNGTLTLVATQLGIASVREIDEERHRLPGSEGSQTFHGRDLFSVVAARLASRQIGLEEVGPAAASDLVTIAYQRPEFAQGRIAGTIPILDVQFGNVWTNIDRATFEQLGLALGEEVEVRIFDGDDPVYEGTMPFVSTFGDVPQGEPLAYFNSLDNFSLAINWGDFAGTHDIGSGPAWRIELTRP
jgi:S-adenosylmethionine hydrolase